jgi:hypothetical protein
MKLARCHQDIQRDIRGTMLDSPTKDRENGRMRWQGQCWPLVRSPWIRIDECGAGLPGKTVGDLSSVGWCVELH